MSFNRSKLTTLLLIGCAITLAGCTTITTLQPGVDPVVITKVGGSVSQTAVAPCIAQAKESGLNPLRTSTSANPAYRDAVQICIAQKGFVVIGWN